MHLKGFFEQCLHGIKTIIVGITIVQFSFGGLLVSSVEAKEKEHSKTRTPIKHVIVIIGENRTFDHVFATYVPKSSSDTVWNLLSEKIVKPDGTPGMNYSKAIQSSASDTSKYELAAPTTPYVTLPPAQAGGPFTPYGCQLLGYGTQLPATTNCNTPANVAAVKPFENGLAPEYYQFLLTGGNPETTGEAPDPRIFYDGQDASSLPPGVYQLTQSVHTPTMPYDSYAASPVHRLFQMWQGHCHI